MISIHIEEIKEFMNRLLVGSMFDDFYLYEAVIKTAASFHIDGKLNKDFFDNEEFTENREYLIWKEEKELVYQMIRGKKLPLSFKIIFMADNERKSNFIKNTGLNITEEEIKALNLNVYYDRQGLYVTTGVSLKTFILDKTVEHAWDEYVKKFLNQI